MASGSTDTVKKGLQSVLQKMLGFDRYLFLFSLAKMKTLKWDQRESGFQYFLSILKKDDIVLDIGANIGIMTGLLADACPKGHIHSFEPVPENFKALQRIVDYVGGQNVTLHNIALGDKEGEVEMAMPVVKGVRMQGLSYVKDQTIEGYQGSHSTYKVPLKTLDQLLDMFEKPVAAIKLDVENYEQFVLKGGKNLITTHKPVIYTELWANENRNICFDILEDMGYKPKVVEKKELVDYNPSIHSHQNFFFLP